MIYLHIGLPKTGSSAIQVYLNEHHQQLAARGVLYPWPHTYPQKYRTSGGNFRPINHILSSSDPVSKISAFQDELKALAAAHSKIIISSEAFAVRFPDPMRVRTLLPADFEATVVVYVRNQIDKFVSDVNQTIKNGFRANYEVSPSWLKFNDYYSLLKSWSQAFGKMNLLIRVYDKHHLYNNDVVEDFCRILDVPYLGYDTSQPINPSLGLEYLELMRMINQVANMRGERTAKRRLKDYIWDLSVRAPKRREGGVRQTLVSRDSMVKIADTLERSNRLMSKEFHVPFLDLHRAIDAYTFIEPGIDPNALYDVLLALLEK